MLPISFNITGVVRTRMVGTLAVAISDDFRRLAYVGKPTAEQAPISYIGMPELSQKNLEIENMNELSGNVAVHENSYFLRLKTVSQQDTFDLPTRGALITNEVALDSFGEATPLFYKHELPLGFSTVPEIFDQDLALIPSSVYKVILSGDEIFIAHDLAPTIDIDSLKFSAYFIRYSDADGKETFSLLDSKPLFREGSIMDWPPGQKRLYTVRPLGTTFRYRILPDVSGPFHIRTPQTSQLKMSAPRALGQLETWNLNLEDSELYARTNDGIKRYYIPEFHTQPFTPIEPFQTSGTKRATILSDHFVVCPDSSLSISATSPLDLIVLSESLEPKWAYTTATEQRFWQDKVRKGSTDSQTIVYPLSPATTSELSINSETGLIFLGIELAPTDLVYARYTKELKQFAYRDLNLNPLFNRNLLAGKAVVYIKAADELGVSLRAVHHLIIDSQEDIIDWSDLLLGEDGELSGALIADDETSYTKFRALYPNNLIVGLAEINRNGSIQDLSFIDIRDEGGGLAELVESNLERFTAPYPEIQWIGKDSLKEKPVPLHGVGTVGLPLMLLNEAGGEFSREDLEAICSEHASLGAYLSQEFNSISPEIIHATSFSAGPLSGIGLKWKKTPLATGYQVYLSRHPDKGFLPIDIIGEEEDARPELLIGSFMLPENNMSIGLSGQLYIYICAIYDENIIEKSSLFLYSFEEAGSLLASLDVLIASPPLISTSLEALIVGA